MPGPQNRSVTSSPRTRVSQLDGIRAVAITLVFFNHAFRLPLFWFGVDLFFVLSGYLITGVLLSRRSNSLGMYFGHFYERRARRILPPYLVLLVVVSAFYGVSSWGRHWYFYLFLMNLILPLHISEPKAMAVLWSLAVEEQFYLIWPLAVRYLSERVLGICAASLILAAPLLRWFCSPHLPNLWYAYALTPFRMDCLASGALLALVSRWKPQLTREYGIWGLLLLVPSSLGLLWLSHLGITTSANSQLGNTFIYECTLGISVGLMTWALSGKYVGVLKLRPVVYLGRISYTVYLMHLFFLIVAERVVHERYAAAALGAIMVIAFASVTWFLMERPLLEGWSAGKRKAEAKSVEEPARQESTV
jgi:peptidoglycan/LPS O-acetylase OafA/YrhL